MRAGLLLIVSLLLWTQASRAERPTAPDPLPRGPHAVATGEYKLPAAVDRDVLPRKATELWARVFWPRDLSTASPILVFLHGNHSTCGAGRDPRSDSDCTYTHEGRCPEGFIVVPNHEGYNYSAEHLASHGYVVVSVNANRGITCGDGVDGDSGLNLARGRLVLRHLQSWHKWATEGDAPASLGVSPSAFVKKIDFENVGLMGHSRGGEGVRAAYNLYRDRGSPWQRRVPGLNIKGIFEIGGVDGQTSRVLDADDTAWNQLLPMCDGDVSDLAGRMPYERMLRKRDEAVRTPKSLYMVWGANHNFFNTEWQENDAFECTGHDPIHGPGPESEKQKAIGIASLSSFFRANVGRTRDSRFGLQFDPVALLPSSVLNVTRVDRDHVATFDSEVSLRVDDFDQPTGRSSTGQENLAKGVTVKHESREPSHATLGWSTRGADHYFQTNWAARGSGTALPPEATLDFRIGRHDAYKGKPPTEFHVQLADPEDGLSVAVPVSRFTEVLGPVHTETLFQTVRIPIQEFQLRPGTKIRGVRFVFDQSRAGSIYLANVRFSTPFSAPLSISAEDSSRDFMPELRRLETPINVREEPAELVSVKRVVSSSQWNLKPTVEITVRSPVKFPVTAQLPTLVLSGRTFDLSRYPSTGGTDTIIFSVNPSTFKDLPDSGPMFIQYGNRAANRIWRLPDYIKSDLIRK